MYKESSGDCRQSVWPVCRGGSWINNGRNLRSAYRNNWHHDQRNDNNGLRLARIPLSAGRQKKDQTASGHRPLQVRAKSKAVRGVSRL
ncbi:hypothetical protein [Desulfobacter postgatei]|uniref:hypothetical protein n=1 Tax=Desulfobacter postgatei TaxID=2293 RepID=UPI00259B8DE0|nr:hypothetical protein [uncultured Desulfobacter sp.]